MPWLAHHENVGPEAVDDRVDRQSNPPHSSQQQDLDRAEQFPSQSADSRVQQEDPAVVG